MKEISDNSQMNVRLIDLRTHISYMLSAHREWNKEISFDFPMNNAIEYDKLVYHLVLGLLSKCKAQFASLKTKN